MFLLSTYLASCVRPPESAIPVADDSTEPIDSAEPCVETAWYRDFDADGYGDAGTRTMACERPDDAVADAGDCDDSSAAIHPGAVELCNGFDDNCDGNADAASKQAWYADADGDGYGDSATLQTTCYPAPGSVLDGTDCDDTAREVHPGAVELCNGFDDDCDGMSRNCWFEGDHTLADADVKLDGVASGDDVGRLIDAGDVDGDGLPDLVVPTLLAADVGGGAFVVLGPPPLGEHPISDAGVRIAGDETTKGAGQSVGVADGTTDGVDDVILGAPYTDEAFVMFGPITADLEVRDADMDLVGFDNTSAGHGTDLADVNGDGVAEALIGAYDKSGSGPGIIYVFEGALEAGTYSLDEDADARVVGEPDQGFGRVIRAGADMNGDGIGDILASATDDDTGGTLAGTVYVFDGPVVGVESIADAAGTMVGESPYSSTGLSVAQGDVDGDGRADAAIGAHNNDEGGTRAGSAYVVLGPVSGTFDLAGAPVIVRGEKNDILGGGVTLGDIDADGRADLLAGAPCSYTTDAGNAYLFVMPAEGVLSSSDASAAFAGDISGQAAGRGVFVGDVDSSGSADLIVGAPRDPTGGDGAGALYLFVAPK